MHLTFKTDAIMKKASVTVLSTGLILILSLGRVCGQQGPGEINGKVFFKKGGKTAIGATVSTQINGNVFGTFVDIDGKYTLKPLPPGYYLIEFTYTGFLPFEIQTVEVTANSITFLKDVHLEEKINDLPIFRVPGYVYELPLIDIEDPKKMKVTRAELINSPNRQNPTAIVANISPEIKKGPDQQLYFRGSRANSMITFIDGVKLMGSISGVTGNSIRSITVYTGGLPAKYGDTLGGVIALETMSYQDMVRMRNMGLQ